MKYLLILVFVAMLQKTSAIRSNDGHLQRGRSRRVSTRNTPLEKKFLQLDELEAAVPMVRRRAGSPQGYNGKGKGGKGKTSGYEVDVLSDHVLDGTALDDQGTMEEEHDTEGTPADTPIDMDVPSDGYGDAYESGDSQETETANGQWDSADNEGGDSLNGGGEDGNTDETTANDEDVNETTQGEETSTPGISFGNDATDNLDPYTADDPSSIRQAQCTAATTSNENEDTVDKTITYLYTVTTESGFGIDALVNDILPGLELAILAKLAESQEVMACLDTSSSRRRMDAISSNEDRHRRLMEGVLRLKSDPYDEPTDMGSAQEICATNGCTDPVLIKGQLTAVADEGSNLYEIECNILPLIEDVLSTAQVDGLDQLVYEPDPPEYCVESDNSNVESGVKVQNGNERSEPVPAGLVIGAALGGMFIVLVGLLVVRQRMARKRDDNATIVTKQTKTSNTCIDDRSALESTVMDDTATQQTKYISQKATESSDSSCFLGISASPSDCSEWGDKGRTISEDDDDNTEAPPTPVTETKADPEPSDITFADDQTLESILTAKQVIAAQSNAAPPASQQNDLAGSAGLPSDEAQDVPFEPNVREESLMHSDLDHDGDREEC